MNRIFILVILSIIFTAGCSDKNKSENRVAATKDMCDKLYDLIDANESGVLSDSLFKTKADSLRIAIDFSAGDMTVAEWDSIKHYEAKLLDELIQKKIDREKLNKAE